MAIDMSACYRRDPPGAAGGDRGQPLLSRGQREPAGEPGAGSPEWEGPLNGAVVLAVFGMPRVDLVLQAVSQGRVAVSDPAEECGGFVILSLATRRLAGVRGRCSAEERRTGGMCQVADRRII
ncbi:hypothetical protein [Umezawaea sp. NPDC059074]|uniref:hypothetical protein n=1 Tax=Umezawaea sp. NPDC059074 TaxID=3346716 RepID=UPI0036C2EB0D